MTRLKAHWRRRSGNVGRLSPDAESAATRQALAWAPLDWQLYFARATARRLRPGNAIPSSALEDFRRARYLQPFAGDPATRRPDSGRRRVNRRWRSTRWPRLAAANPTARRVTSTATWPTRGGGQTKPSASAAAHGSFRHDPAVSNCPYLRSLDPPDMGPVIANLFTKDDPDLRGVRRHAKETFLRFWAIRGATPPRWLPRMEAHPDWQALGWRAWAAACAGLRTRKNAPASSPPVLKLRPECRPFRPRRWASRAARRTPKRRERARPMTRWPPCTFTFARNARPGTMGRGAGTLVAPHHVWNRAARRIFSTWPHVPGRKNSANGPTAWDAWENTWKKLVADRKQPIAASTDHGHGFTAPTAPEARQPVERDQP